MKRLLEIIKALVEIWNESRYRKKRIKQIGLYEYWKEEEALRNELEQKGLSKFLQDTQP